MKRAHKSKAAPKAEQIAAMADRGKDVSSHFTNTGKMMPAVRRVNVDFAEGMLKELGGADGFAYRPLRGRGGGQAREARLRQIGESPIAAGTRGEAKEAVMSVAVDPVSDVLGKLRPFIPTEGQLQRHQAVKGRIEAGQHGLGKGASLALLDELQGGGRGKARSHKKRLAGS